MTQLKEELRPKPGEDALAYAERVEARLERHNKETGERLSRWSILDGEGPGDALERERVLSEADKIRAASRQRKLSQDEETPQAKERDMSMDENARAYRIKSQEREVERAIADFEENRARLYRRDGSKVYGEAEHSERLTKLTSVLSEKVEAVIAEAQEDAQSYEREALALSYTDPTSGLASTDRERFLASLPLVREGCEGLSADALVERLRAVAAGSDKVAKVLHARYGARRAQAEDRRLEEIARQGGSVSVEDAQALRELQESVSELEEQTEDKEVVRRREATTLRRRRSEADGSDERVRQEYREHMRSTI
jgi:hypothetical protein